DLLPPPGDGRREAARGRQVQPRRRLQPAQVHQPAQPANLRHRLLQGKPQYLASRKIVRGVEQGQRPGHRCTIPTRESAPRYLAASSIWTGYPALSAATVDGGVMTLAVPCRGLR